MPRVLLAMSGGVDSSVAAHLLRTAGHDVVGVFMRHGETLGERADGSCTLEARASTLPIVSNPGRPFPATGPPLQARRSQPQVSSHRQGCCSAADAEDARCVADRLDIPFYALDFQDAFTGIMDYFVAEYTAARTPNPCVMCNNWVKFGKLFEYADSIGADFVATGHYARLAMCPTPPATGFALLRGLDADKDQSYVLFGLRRERLPRVLFPVGEYRKAEIRRLAAKMGLRVADKRDSQEICFVNAGHHAEFVRRRRARSGDDRNTAGEIVTTAGRVVGRHAGIEAFTIGQRHGLGVALGEPHFVVRLEADTRRVVIGRREELGRAHVTANRTNWLVDPPTAPTPCTVKIRYNTPAAPATVNVLPDDRLEVTFDQPQCAVAPGQAVVCYDGDRVLGGGWIE